MAEDVRGLLGTLATVDRRAAVWCACQCARVVLPLVAEGEASPRVAIETAERWVRGEATAEECNQAANAVRPASAAVQPAFAADAARAAAFAAAGAAARPSDAAYPLQLRDADPFRYATPADAAGAAAHAAAYSAGHDVFVAARNALLFRLASLVSTRRWPLIVPRPDPLDAAPAAIRVAWGAVGDDRIDHTIADLIGAHARAERLGLDWSDPVQRAIAERTSDEAYVRRLLAANRHGSGCAPPQRSILDPGGHDTPTRAMFGAPEILQQPEDRGARRPTEE